MDAEHTPRRHGRRPDLGQPTSPADRCRAPVIEAVESALAIIRHLRPDEGVQAAWAVKERLRLLLREREPSKIRWRLADFYEAAIDAQLPEATRLAGTIQTWWPAVLTALLADVDNARTEGFNRIIKQVKRTGCGYRNMINYQRRILTHTAVTRPQRSAA